VANIRRGLERIGSVLMMWGILVTSIGIYYDFVGGVDEKIPVAIVAWGPFILFKLLAWVGSGFFDEE
jgi:hypothetical protein